VVKIHHDRSVENVLNFIEYQQLADESRVYTSDEDDQVKETWLMKLGHPGYGHGFDGTSPTNVDRNVATVSYSVPAWRDVNHNQKRTLPEGSEVPTLPIGKKARLNAEPIFVTAASHHSSSQHDQRSLTIENIPHLIDRPRYRRGGNK
jgi:hypothetical protein